MSYQNQMSEVNRQKTPMIPQKITNVSECDELYDIYKKSYNIYYKNKYNSINKYHIIQ